MTSVFADRSETECELVHTGREKSDTDSVWTPEAVRLLEKNYGPCPAGEIAKQIGSTRNAVIGKASRIGLSASKIMGTPLFEADLRGCRFIEGEPLPLRPGMYCCAPVAKAGGSWCVEHLAVVWPAGKEPR